MSLAGILEVRACPHGRGVFALRGFAAGEPLRSFHDVVLTTSPASPPWRRWAMIVGRTADGKHLFWDEEPEGSSDYWSNFLDHGDTPNVRFQIDLTGRTARLVATRAIDAGDELLLNYREYDSDNWAPS
ncbi:MAG: SET domain-containing protein [Nitrososphaerota archaeon]|nr:SET domain-containing protein [Nitrososphaerota archaeon]